MDFFDTLRQGCAFGKTKRSKHVTFARPFEHTGAADAARSRTDASSLDFFGYGGPDVDDDCEKQACGEEEPATKSLPTESSPSKEVEMSRRRPKVPKAALTPEQLKEQVTAFRRKKRIHVSNGAPDPVVSFDDMPARGVPEWLVSNLRGLGFGSPTPIQMQCFPAIMGGSHVLASAPTGSGKTIAFLGPLLALMANPAKEFGRTVIIDPTRELARQTLDEFSRLSASSSSDGGEDKKKRWRCRLLDQIPADKAKGLKRIDVLVATPLRLATLLREKVISLEHTRHMVLDEADKLLDMGFAPQIDEILSHVPTDRPAGSTLQMMMFSATLPPVVCELANSILTEPLRIGVGDVNAAAAEVEQKLVFITNEDGKLFSFRQLVQEGQIKPPALIFVQSKERAKELFGELVYDGLFVDAIHADRTKSQRDNSIKAFREGRTWMLICTDVLSRGVDFKGVETVINYDFPQAAGTYIHRIGRTGRAGRHGKAITLFTIEDFEYMRSIVGVMRQSGCEVPEWMLRLKPMNKKAKRMAERRPPERKQISTVSKYDRKMRWQKKKQSVVKKGLKNKKKQDAKT